MTVGREKVDLTRQASTERWVEDNRPDAIFVAAARVGGILANASFPADFLYDNLMIEATIIAAAHRVGVQKLLFLDRVASTPNLLLNQSQKTRC